MPSETPVVLELDDIQSGALHGRPSPYVGVHILLRIDDRRAGREFLRGVIPALAPAANPADPDQSGLGHRRAHLSGPEGVGSATGFARQLSAGIPTGHGRARGRIGRCRRERARTLGKAVRDPGRPCRDQRALARRGAARGRTRQALEKRTNNCQGSALSGVSSAMCCPPNGRRSDSGTA